MDTAAHTKNPQRTYRPDDEARCPFCNEPQNQKAKRLPLGYTKTGPTSSSVHTCINEDCGKRFITYRVHRIIITAV